LPTATNYYLLDFALIMPFETTSIVIITMQSSCLIVEVENVIVEVENVIVEVDVEVIAIKLSIATSGVIIFSSIQSYYISVLESNQRMGHLSFTHCLSRVNTKYSLALNLMALVSTMLTDS
jgi:hypothetical protein